jgi:hypothetical protein
VSRTAAALASPIVVVERDLLEPGPDGGVVALSSEECRQAQRRLQREFYERNPHLLPSPIPKSRSIEACSASRVTVEAS